MPQESVTEPIAAELRLRPGRVPVTIITGFLGSGKTTLLNHILNHRQDLKIAVLVNEFGNIDIDSQLLTSADQDMLQLSNGCICCTINNDLVAAVNRLLVQRDRIDYLIVETTGVADPLPIIMTFLGTNLRDDTTLDGVLTLIDAAQFTPDCFDSQAAVKQIVYGDLLLLNKTDLVDTQRLDEIEQTLAKLRPNPKVLRIQQAQIPLSVILGLEGLSLERWGEMPEGAGHEQHHGHHQDHHHHGHDHAQDHDHDHDHDHGKNKLASDHLTEDGFMSVAFESDRPFSLRGFQKFLDCQLPQQVYRGKGIVWFADSQQRHVFQLSGKRISLDSTPWSQPPRTQLVFIGRDLDPAWFQAQLQACEL